MNEISASSATSCSNPKTMKTKLSILAALSGLIPAVFAGAPDDGSVLPFPPAPTASKAGPTLQESIHKRRVEPDRLPKGAPNVLMVLIDDAGFGVPDTLLRAPPVQVRWKDRDGESRVEVMRPSGRRR